MFLLSDFEGGSASPAAPAVSLVGHSRKNAAAIHAKRSVVHTDEELAAQNNADEMKPLKKVYKTEVRAKTPAVGLIQTSDSSGVPPPSPPSPSTEWMLLSSPALKIVAFGALSFLVLVLVIVNAQLSSRISEMHKMLTLMMLANGHKP